MREYDDEIIIDIGAMCQALLKKIHIILLAGILCASAAFGISKFMITPKYDSTTKILVISRQNEDMVTYTDLQLGTVLKGDYMQLVTSRTVLEEVIQELKLDMTTGKLKSFITVEEVEDTRIVSITVTNEDPIVARDIANTLRIIVGKQFEKVTSIDSIFTVEDANLPRTPSTPNVIKYTLLGGFLGTAIAMAVVLVMFLMDDSIKTAQDIETYLEMSVLASLPLEEDGKTKTNSKLLRQQKRNRWRKKQ